MESLRRKIKNNEPRGGKLLLAEDTACGRVHVLEQPFRGHRARLLLVDGALESAMALEEGERQTLLFPYMQGFDWAVRLRPHSSSALLIGGGGFVYADHFLHSMPGARMDVAELSEEIVALSRHYFSLAALESEAATRDRFSLFVTDGLSYLLGTDRQYDLLFNDAFIGRTPDAGLFGADGIALCKAHLKTGGLVACNLVTAIKGPESLAARSVKKRFGSCFRYMALLQADETRSPYERQNCVLLASDEALEPQHM